MYDICIISYFTPSFSMMDLLSLLSSLLYQMKAFKLESNGEKKMPRFCLYSQKHKTLTLKISVK